MGEDAGENQDTWQAWAATEPKPEQESAGVL